MAFVRFVEILSGKVTTPNCDGTMERAKQLFAYAKKVATADYRIELVEGDCVIKSHTVEPFVVPAWDDVVGMA